MREYSKFGVDEILWMTINNYIGFKNVGQRK